MPNIATITPLLLTRLLREGWGDLAARDEATVRCMDALGRCQGEAACAVAGREVIVTGASDHRFTLMSAVKPFLLMRVLECYGAEPVADWVDDEPSALPYFSLEQLLADGGKPRNAMINSGAMLLASKLPGADPEEQERLFVEWLGELAPEASLVLDNECFADLMQRGADTANSALAAELERTGGIPTAAAAYDIYFRICCLAGTIVDVAKLGHALAVGGSLHRDQVLRTISRCGLYEASGAWFAGTKLLAKSGVSGVIFGVWPGQGCVAVCSPWLDEGGNPIIPQAVLARLAEAFPAGDCEEYGNPRAGRSGDGMRNEICPVPPGPCYQPPP